MAYKTYSEQMSEHITFLRNHGLDITELQINVGFIRCRSAGQIQGRGELTYKTTGRALDNGSFGLSSWCRAADGSKVSFQTYGLPPNSGEMVDHSAPAPATPLSVTSTYEEAARRAYGFWMKSSEKGKSDYLKRKGVSAHGIRFRSSDEYGNVAVVPMRDIDGRLWNRQILNPDGSKLLAKGARTDGLFHSLRPIIDGQPFGIAESYVTAATCMEVTGITCVCSFGCNNIKNVTVALHARHPKSSIIIFADNDRHLKDGNQGVLKAQEAKNSIKGEVVAVEPDFGEIRPSKEASDWNDLARLKGLEEVRSQLSSFLC